MNSPSEPPPPPPPPHTHENPGSASRPYITHLCQ